MKIFILLILCLFSTLSFAQNDSCQKIIQSLMSSRVPRSNPIEKQAWANLEEGNFGVSLIGAPEINKYLISLIESAQKTLELQTFKIYEKDWVELLIKKAKEGVQIRIQITDVSRVAYSDKVRKEAISLIKKMEEAGILVDQFDPKVLQRNTYVYSPDMHKKIVVVDNKYAYIGNKNFNSFDNSIEFGVGLKGPSAKDLRSLFYKDLTNSNQEVKYLNEILTIGQYSKINFLNTFGLKNKLIQSIKEAKKSITLAQVEFNDPDVLKALINKKKDNPSLDIKIITTRNEKTYSLSKLKLTRTFNIRAIEELKQNGIGVYSIDLDRVSEKFFHGKMSLFDGEKVVIGSSDYNVRSLEGNVELDLELASPVMAQEFEVYLKHLIADKPTDFKFTNSEKLLSFYFDFITDLLFKLNKLKVHSVDKLHISTEYLELVIRRQIGSIAQQIILLRKNYELKTVKSFDQIYKTYKKRLISREIFNDSPLEDDEFYVFVGTNSFVTEKMKKGEMSPSLNGQFGKGFYFATNMETSINYSLLRNKQDKGKSLVANILVFRFKGQFNRSVLSQSNSTETNALMLEAVEGFGRDYLLLQDRTQFELAGHLKILAL